MQQKTERMCWWRLFCKNLNECSAPKRKTPTARKSKKVWNTTLEGGVHASYALNEREKHQRYIFPSNFLVFLFRK